MFIEANGVGHSLKHIGRNKSDSRPELLHASDPVLHRTLSWAILGAGSRVAIEATQKNVGSRFRLEIDVRKVYEKLSIHTTLGDILLDSECTWLSIEDCAREDHGTILEIYCDGSREIVNGYQPNRVYELTTPDEGSLRKMLVENWPDPGSRKCYGRNHGHANYNVSPAICVDGRAIDDRLSIHAASKHPRIYHRGLIASVRS